MQKKSRNPYPSPGKILKDTMTSPVDEPCEQCGLCCRIFGPDIAPTAANVYAGNEQGRTDILRWYIAFIKMRDAGAVHEPHGRRSQEIPEQ